MTPKTKTRSAAEHWPFIVCGISFYAGTLFKGMGDAAERWFLLLAVAAVNGMIIGMLRERKDGNEHKPR